MTVEAPLWNPELLQNVDETTLSGLQGFQLAKARAERCNRNLLQYGAAIATLLGISAGTGSMLALADSMSKAESRPLPEWAQLTLIAEGTVLMSVSLSAHGSVGRSSALRASTMLVPTLNGRKIS